MKKIGVVIGLTAILSGCQSVPQEVFVRTDGQKMTGNPALMRQGEIDRTICNGEMQKSAVGQAPVYYNGTAGAISAGIINQQRSQGLSDIMKGCMAQKGYIAVPADQAAAKAAEFRGG